MARDTTLFKHLLNVKGTVIEDIEFFHETDGTKSAVVQVHATRGYRCRCPHCNRKSPRYDSARNDQVRLWRAGDLNGIRVYLQAESYRICCPKHGVVTAAVPWAFHGSRFTKDLSSDIRIDPQNDIKIDPPPKGKKERHLTCRPGTAGRPWRGKARQMPFLAAAHPPVVYSKLPNADLVQVFGIKERQQPLHRLQ